MPLLVLVIAILALAAVAIAAAARGEGLVLDPARTHDRAPLGLPPDGQPIAAEHLRALRLAVAFRGYRMDEVDAVLDRIAVDLAARDARIRELTGQVQAASPARPAVPPPDVERAVPDGWLAQFWVSVPVHAPAGRTWAALVDWTSHREWIPLTRMRVTSPSPEGVGASFIGRTGIGRLGFDDPMVITHWEPPVGDRPGVCAVRKTGRIVLGRAGFIVEPVDAHSSVVRWHYVFGVAPIALTRRARPVLAFVGRLAVGAALRRFARVVERA